MRPSNLFRPAPASRPEKTFKVSTSVKQVLALFATALLSSACSKPATEVQSPSSPSPVNGPVSSQAVPASSLPPSTGASDPSLPDAGVIPTPASPPKPGPDAGRTNTKMSPTQESVAMPLPGQNNDHSAPLEPAKRPKGAAG